MYFAKPQKAIIAGNYTRDLDCSESLCCSIPKRDNVVFINAKETLSVLTYIQKGCIPFVLLLS